MTCGRFREANLRAGKKLYVFVGTLQKHWKMGNATHFTIAHFLYLCYLFLRIPQFSGILQRIVQNIYFFVGPLILYQRLEFVDDGTEFGEG